MNDEPSARDVAQFVSSVIDHDLNNPLYSSCQHLQLLQRLELPVEQRAEMLTTALLQVQRAQHVVNEVAAYCRRIIDE